MISTSCFLREALRADVDFALELLFFGFFAVVTDLFFFLRGMSETILPYEKLLLFEMLLQSGCANLLPLIPTPFQQFSEKGCGKAQGTIAAMQKSCVF